MYTQLPLLAREKTTRRFLCRNSLMYVRFVILLWLSFSSSISTIHASASRRWVSVAAPLHRRYSRGQPTEPRKQQRQTTSYRWAQEHFPLALLSKEKEVMLTSADSSHSPRSTHTTNILTSNPWWFPSSRFTARLFARRTPQFGSGRLNVMQWTVPSSHASTVTQSPSPPPFPRVVDDDNNNNVQFADLGLMGKIVAGTVDIVVTTLLEYVSAFVGGYTLGALTDIPRFLGKPVISTAQASSHSFWSQFWQRSVRLHGKSVGWAHNWGSLSACFGGFRVATKVLRGGQEDEWSTILSSMAAGAFLARKDGPQAMLRGAVVYGGIMYMLGGNFAEKKQPFQYMEETIDL